MVEKQTRKNAQLPDPETWIDQYGDYLYAYALSRIQDPSIAEDLVQETFLILMMHHWMFNCKEVTRMVSQSLDNRLPFRHKIGLRIHFLMCKFCRRYNRQLWMLRDIMRLHTMEREDPAAPFALPSEARKRINDSLRTGAKM